RVLAQNRERLEVEDVLEPEDERGRVGIRTELVQEAWYRQRELDGSFFRVVGKFGGAVTLLLRLLLVRRAQVEPCSGSHDLEKDRLLVLCRRQRLLDSIV